MEKLMYTSKEIKQIKNTMKLILEDMYEIWKLSSQELMVVNVKEEALPLDNTNLIIIQKSGISLVVDDETPKSQKLINIAQLSGRNLKLIDNDAQLQNLIINNYTKIREILLTSAEKSNALKKEQMQEVYKWQNRFKKDVIIELDLPKTNNRHTIDVIQEDGKNIGVIDFGGKTIKIITDGDIVLENREVPKEKVKSK